MMTNASWLVHKKTCELINQVSEQGVRRSSSFQFPSILYHPTFAILKHLHIFTTHLKTSIMNTDQSIKLEMYVNYPGHCEKAFRFYEEHLGGKITMMMPHQQAPPNFPKEWQQPILHATMELGGTLLRGADVPHAEPMRSAYLTLVLDTAEKAEDIYSILAEGGEIFMKMEQTFFANRFAMLRDQFGTSWMLLQHE
jgi:PhnB protein